MIRRTKLVIGFALLLNIFIVWIPTRFQNEAIQEEWRIRALFDGNITTYGDSGNKTTDEIFDTRPFIGVLNHIAYRLTPDSFLSHHLILILTLFAKGYILFLIFQRLLPDHPLIGYMSALLLIFYPSDPAIVSIRVIHTHLAIVFILLSIYLLITYYQTSKRWLLVAMWISQAIAGFTIEIGYPLFFFTPLIILLLEKHITRRFLITTILFYIVPAITFFYSFVLILLVQVSWQRTAIASYDIGDYIHNIFNLYETNFINAWVDTIHTITTGLTAVDILIFISTAFVTLIGAMNIIRQTKNPTHPWKPLLIVCIGGLFTVLLGYAMFLPSRTHVLTNYRVYLLASVGVATVISTIIYSLYLKSSTLKQLPPIILLLFSMLVGLTGVFASKTHQEYLAISALQEKIVRQITTIIPALTDDAHILIKTESNTIYKGDIGEMQKPVLFTPMLQYIYNDYEHLQSGIICFKHYLDCVFTPDGLELDVTNFTNIDTPVPYSQLIMFNIDHLANLELITEDDALPDYDPLRLIDQTATQPRRIQTIYGSPSP